MKKFIVFFVFAFIVNFSFENIVYAQKPMCRLSYKWYHFRMERKKNDEKRQKYGNKRLKRKNISVNQVFKATQLFTDDNYKLIYFREAYPKITDKSNVIVLVDLFTKTSHLELVKDYIKKENAKLGIADLDLTSYTDYLKLSDRKKDKQTDNLAQKSKIAENNSNSKEIVENQQKKQQHKLSNTQNIVEISSKEEIFYPIAANYMGTKGCSSVISDVQFTALKNTISKYESSEERTQICMKYLSQFCISTAQIMELSELIINDNHKYVLFKTSYSYIYDKDSYHYVTQMLKDEKNIKSLIDYLKNL